MDPIHKLTRKETVKECKGPSWPKICHTMVNIPDGVLAASQFQVRLRTVTGRVLQGSKDVSARQP